MRCKRIRPWLAVAGRLARVALETRLCAARDRRGARHEQLAAGPGGALADVDDRLPQVRAAARDLARADGNLDVVINNAGYGNLSSVEDTPMSDFRAQIETNLFGTIIVTKAALPYFRQRKASEF